MKRTLTTCSLMLLSACSLLAERDESLILNDFLKRGALAEGVEFYQSQPSSLADADKFSLGTLQTLSALEEFLNELRAMGPDLESFRELDFLRDAPDWLFSHSNPEPVDYAKVRQVLERLERGLQTASETLNGVGEEGFAVVIQPLQIQLGLEQGADRQIMAVLQLLGMNPTDESVAAASEQEVRFDRGDAYWLRGYCNLLSAHIHLILAHDFEEPFNLAAHHFFAEVNSPFMNLYQQDQERTDFLQSHWVDLIAGILRVDLPVIEPTRLEMAREQLLIVIRTGRLSWEAILAETDNDREWIPGPQQESVLPFAVSEAQLDGWQGFLDDAEAILEGELLIPHWRVTDGRGINLKRVFTDPRPFDLILWIHGAATVPYLEPGEVMSVERWEEIQREFGTVEGFFTFAFIVN